MPHRNDFFTAALLALQMAFFRESERTFLVRSQRTLEVRLLNSGNPFPVSRSIRAQHPLNP
jgi:hypothetical protein